MAGKPHIWHIHEPLLGNSELAPLLPTWLYEAVARTLSAKIIFPSYALAHQYSRLTSLSTVIYNGLPFQAPRDRQLAHRIVAKALGLDARLRFVAVVGALQPRKDHLTFLNAAKQAANRLDSVAFLIVGAGSESYTATIRSHIERLGLESTVTLAGWWPGEIQELMAGIDVLVISSEQESFGLTAIEALAMETPVIATRCGGPEEIIEDDKTGLLVPVQGPSHLAAAIERVLADEDLAHRYGVTGRCLVAERFGSAQYVDGVQETIQSVVSSAAASITHSCSDASLKKRK
jgi:glycosyltransferase involved in cell wall biosynthesis